jgi:hypothetical protein
MDIMNKQILFLLTILTLIPVNVFSQVKPDIEKALQAIRPEAIKADMSFLADDLLEGRRPGTVGFALASRFVETRLIAMGLEPGVEGDTYIQKVTLQNGSVVEGGSSLSLMAGDKIEPLTYGKEFILNPNPTLLMADAAAPLVFVGFGVHAPELGYDDFEKADVQGKIIVFFGGAPSSFPSNERAYFSSASVKYEEAEKRGAVGAISLRLPGGRRFSWDGAVQRARRGRLRWVDGQGKGKDAFEHLKVMASFNQDHAEKIFAHSGTNMATAIATIQGNKPQSFPLNVDARMKVKTTVTQVESSNLIGIIPGSDPVLKDEYVVIAAHVDHLGIGTPSNGDVIYNGAHDNASGVSILLGIARTFQRLKVQPKRSILIAVVTAEESGLLGSDYFATHPTVKQENIVANISLDMPFFFHPILDIVPYGAQHSSLSEPLTTAANYLNLEIGPDPFPERVIFIRSDHFSFVKKGIPSLFIKSGFKTVAGDPVDRSITDVEWRSTTYHTPRDDMSQAFDFNAAVTHVKLNFLTAYLIANDPKRPTWNKGDIFGNKFGRP